MARHNIQGFIALAGLSATTLFAAQPPNASSVLSDGFYNTAMGPGALSNDVTPGKPCVPYALSHSSSFMSGCANTAAGFLALNRNATGFGNTATGAGALYADTTGAYNTAAGVLALFTDTTGAYNVATGANALASNTTGDGNVATGYFALFGNTKGGSNVAYGASALAASTSGNFNTAIGFGAGADLTTGSNNTYIGFGANAISGADNYVTIIGSANPAATTYIAGITNSQVAGAQVYVTANGQLGVLASSERYKTDVATLGSVGERLAQLRPVSFHLKTDPTGALQYGLIAEEVDRVYPELVIRDNDGKIQGVRYDELTPMLLNQVQQQAAQISELKQQVAELNSLKQQMHAALHELQARDQLNVQP